MFFSKRRRPVAPWLPVELDIGCAVFSSQSKFHFDIQPLKTAADGAVQLISISFEFFQGDDSDNNFGNPTMPY